MGNAYISMLAPRFYKTCFLVFYLFVFFMLTSCVTYTNQAAPYGNNYDDKTASQIYLNIGLLRLSQQNTEQAERYLLKSYKLEKKQLETIEALALVYQLKQDYTKSAEWFGKALHIDKHNGRLNYNYGILLFHQKKYAKAINAFSTAIQDTGYDNSINAKKNIARCRQALDEMESAQ